MRTLTRVICGIVLMLSSRAGMAHDCAEELQKFHTLLQEIESEKSAFSKIPVEPPNREWVKKKLAHMVSIDQKIRHFRDERLDLSGRERFRAEWRATDQANTADLSDLVKIHGWITISQFGGEASFNAWLLAQHADRNPGFQRQILKMMEPLVMIGEVTRKNFAFLTDRIAVAEGRPQTYGTQFIYNGVDRYVPAPIADPERVDELRAAIGMPPIAESMALANQP